jgi:hypothetical protein
LETYFRHVKSLISKTNIFSFLFKLKQFFKVLYRKLQHHLILVLANKAVKKVIDLVILGVKRTVYIKNIFSRKIEYKPPVKGVLHYLNPFTNNRITIPVLCLISITYAFHVMFMITLIPALDTIVSPTNIMIGLLKDKIGIKIATILCFLFTVDAIFFFNLPYTISFLNAYKLDGFQSTGALLTMLGAGTVMRLLQSMAWYKSLKKWIV